jgi:hypothetical protein
MLEIIMKEDLGTKMMKKFVKSLKKMPKKKLLDLVKEADKEWEKSHPKQITGSTEDLMIGLVRLSDVKACSDYELISLINYCTNIQTERLTKVETKHVPYIDLKE